MPFAFLTIPQLHISIDNLASGHGAVAARAVKQYLESVRLRYGDAGVDEHWRRVLSGFWLSCVNPMKKQLQKYYETRRKYVPYNSELARANNYYSNISTLNDRMVKMIRTKLPFAYNIHGNCVLGNKLLNEWLNPANSDDVIMQLLDTLQGSHWAEQMGDSTCFLTQLCGFGGPMFHIFTPEEEQLIAEWISGWYYCCCYCCCRCFVLF